MNISIGHLRASSRFLSHTDRCISQSPHPGLTWLVCGDLRRSSRVVGGGRSSGLVGEPRRVGVSDRGSEAWGLGFVLARVDDGEIAARG
eukprot:3114900-Rhodomonas_salina.2